jgi:hypothetical protein
MNNEASANGLVVASMTVVLMVIALRSFLRLLRSPTPREKIIFRRNYHSELNS